MPMTVALISGRQCNFFNAKENNKQQVTNNNVVKNVQSKSSRGIIKLIQLNCAHGCIIDFLTTNINVMFFVFLSVSRELQKIL